MFQRLWVRIMAPYTGWTFFALKCKKINYVSLKRPNINDIRGRDWLIYLIKTICLPTAPIVHMIVLPFTVYSR